MNTLSIILIVLAAVIGFAIAFFVKGKGTDQKHEASGDNKNIESNNKPDYDDGLSKLKEVYEKNLSETRVQYDEELSQLKKTYEKKLSEARAQYDELNKQLENSLNANPDEVLKGKIEEVKKLRKEIDDLEEEIDDLEDEKNL